MRSLRLMNRIATWKILVTCLVALTGTSGSVSAEEANQAANEFELVEGPNVRVTRQKDGSKTYFIRTPDNLTLTKKTFTSNGNLCLVTIYRMDSNGNPLGCKILDGQKTELFKVSYGYHKTNGRLLEERMFDCRVRRINPATGGELPVQRVIYLYDAQGKRSAPIALNLLPGKTFEEVYGSPGSALESNPFAEEAPKKQANPKARGIGR